MLTIIIIDKHHCFHPNNCHKHSHKHSHHRHISSWWNISSNSAYESFPWGSRGRDLAPTAAWPASTPCVNESIANKLQWRSLFVLRGSLFSVVGPADTNIAEVWYLASPLVCWGVTAWENFIRSSERLWVWYCYVFFFTDFFSLSVSFCFCSVFFFFFFLYRMRWVDRWIDAEICVSVIMSARAYFV